MCVTLPKISLYKYNKQPTFSIPLSLPAPSSSYSISSKFLILSLQTSVFFFLFKINRHLAICFVEEMAMAKAFPFCIVALLICSLCTETTSANQIGNGAMRADRSKCGGKSCMPPPSNNYSRGCEKETKCRGGRKLK